MRLSLSALPGISRWSKVLFAAFALAPAFARGSLAWKAQEVQLTAKLGDTQAIAVFPFQNTGTTAVTVTEVQPTCTCTTAELLKWNYSPGEAGEIKAVFAFDDRFGPQEKFIKVKTDDPAAPLTTLTFRITIPELVSWTPRSLTWTKGAQPVELSVIITAAESQRIASIDLGDPQATAFTARIEPIEPGRKYQLLVRPVALSEATAAPVPIRCLVRLADGTFRSLLINAVIR